MDSYETINQIPILTILDKLNIQYKKEFGSCMLFSGSDLTHGRVVNIGENYVNDFSGDRARGGPFAFVKSYLGLFDKEVFQWFGDNFGLSFDLTKKQKSKTKVKQKLPKYSYNR